MNDDQRTSRNSLLYDMKKFLLSSLVSSRIFSFVPLYVLYLVTRMPDAKQFRRVMEDQ